MIDVVPARRVLQWALEERVFPAAVVEAGTADVVLWSEAFGRLSYDSGAERARPGTVFDLASLTKVVVTATVAMTLVDHGRLDLDAPVGAWLPQWRGDDRAGVTIRDLLEHASGLPHWSPLYRRCRGRDAFTNAICGMPLEYRPRTRSVYSDLGFILLGILLERCGGAPLDALFDAALPSASLDPAPLVFSPPSTWRPNVAPARTSDDRGVVASGEVDDTNAWALGGVAGHAGLFGSAAAVGAFARSVLRTLDGAGRDAGGLAEPATLRRFLARSTVPGSSRALAWDTMLPTSSCGTRMSQKAFGHTGFTGTSLWIDPGAGVYVVLLTNRVHPAAGDAESIQAVRRGVHDALMDAVTS